MKRIYLPIDDSYLLKRLSEMGLTEKEIEFTLENGEPAQYFSADEEGNIIINYFNLKSGVYSWTKTGTIWPRPFIRKRLKKEIGDQKYFQEKGSPHKPFLTPRIIDKYQQSISIETLFLVEGEFKAFIGNKYGLDIVGIPSIHGFYSNDLKGKLHEDIEKIIIDCKVKNLIFLADADVLTANWKEGKDLRKRAQSFYSAVKNFRESVHLLIEEPLELVAFVHIASKFNKDAKGLDDLLSKYSSVRNQIIEDLYRFHLAELYFRGFILNDINSDLRKVSKYLGLTSPGEFYKVYQEFIEDHAFVYGGKTYQWNGTENLIEEIKSEIPYIRVGTKYYKKLFRPMAGGETQMDLKEWTRSCIEMDHGRDYIKKIERYEDWCYVPDHIEYKPVINDFYNRYYPLNHIPGPGNCDKSLEFVKHIFGEQYELGLDYIQLLYLRPRQILPVLCLVSEARSTGKTTFTNWMVAIFGRNATENRNEDFESVFNSSWVGKLLICVNETFIDKKKVYERLKTVSTGKTIKLEAKGQDSIDSEFFGKLILCSNNEDNFIPVDGSEIRFWIRKIEPFEKEDPNLLSNSLIPEIPAFLQFLLDRQLTTTQKTRMWFTKEDIQTEALDKIVKQNKSWLEKELTEIIVERLEDFQLDKIQYTLGDLQGILAKHGIRDPQWKLKDLLLKRWKLEPKNSSYTKYFYNETPDGTMEKSSKWVSSGKYYMFTRSMFQFTEMDSDAETDAENMNKNYNRIDSDVKNTVGDLENIQLPF